MQFSFLSLDDGVIVSPFGPIEASTLIDDTGALSLTFKTVNSVQAMQILTARRASVVIGRKGSGKTSLLHLLQSKGNIFCQIDLSKELGNVASYLEHDHSRMTSDNASNVWRVVIWNKVIEAANEVLLSKGLMENEEAKLVEKYISALEASTDSIVKRANAELAQKMAQSRKSALPTEIMTIVSHYMEKTVDQAEVISVLAQIIERCDTNVCILVDTLDDVAIAKTTSFRTALAGLLHQAKKITVDNERIDSVVFIPDEILKYSDLGYISDSPLKDFENSCFLKWTADELSLLSSRKLIRVLSEYEGHDLDSIKTEQGSVDFLRELLPRFVTDKFGNQTDTITLIFRHTQLSPRHTLVMMNELFNRKFSVTAGYYEIRKLSEEEFWESFDRSVYKLRADIVGTFSKLFPDFGEILQATLPGLQSVFYEEDLKKEFDSEEIKQEYGVTFQSFKNMLNISGVVGRQVDVAGPTSLAEFSYSSQEGLSLLKGDKYCLHPIFSHQFLRKPSAEIVHPAGSRLRKFIA